MPRAKTRILKKIIVHNKDRGYFTPVSISTGTFRLKVEDGIPNIGSQNLVPRNSSLFSDGQSCVMPLAYVMRIYIFMWYTMVHDVFVLPK